MRINGNMPKVAGMPVGPGGLAGGVGVGSSPMVEGIMQVEALPLESIKQRREKIVAEKNEYSSLSGMLGELGKVAGDLKNLAGFNHFKFESSHPDILDGEVGGLATPGQYEMEVRTLANADKHLARGFATVQDTVGFGFMQIQAEGGEVFDLTVEPGATLLDVRDKINAAGAGVKAQIVNTGDVSDGAKPFRLLVASATTGTLAKINLDPDTTFLDFDHLKVAKDLDVMFEDVPIARAENKVGDLLDGVQINAKRAEPGTKVTVNVTHDADKTVASIKTFTETYNKITGFVNGQNQLGADGLATGTLAGDANLRSVMRSLQSQIAAKAAPATASKKYSNLVDIGITTNAKTGELNLDETKLKEALAADYEGVSNLFVQSESGKGVAARLSDAVRQLQDPMHGVMKNRTKSLDSMIRSQDQAIERQTSRLATRREEVERQFANLNSKMATMQGQSQFLAAKFGTPAATLASEQEA
jgi:flagellar hook-associated protein 2